MSHLSARCQMAGWSWETLSAGVPAQKNKSSHESHQLCARKTSLQILWLANCQFLKHEVLNWRGFRAVSQFPRFSHFPSVEHYGHLLSYEHLGLRKHSTLASRTPQYYAIAIFSQPPTVAYKYAVTLNAASLHSFFSCRLIWTVQQWFSSVIAVCRHAWPRGSTLALLSYNTTHFADSFAIFCAISLNQFFSGLGLRQLSS